MSELVEERSNVFLVRDENGIHPVPKTYRNRLRYNHDYDISDGTTLSVSDRPFIEVTILEDGYDITVGVTKQSAQTTFVNASSNKSRKIEEGVYKSITEEDYSILIDETFPEVRREILGQCVEMLFPRSSISIRESGVLIDDIYRVTWDGELQLNQVQDTAYRPSVNGVRELNSKPEFVEVDFDFENALYNDSKAMDVVREVVEEAMGFDLKDDEIETLTLIQFIIQRKEMTEDELFWSQTEKAVLTEQAEFSGQETDASE